MTENIKYNIPAEHETSALRKLVDQNLGDKIGLARFIPERCWQALSLGGNSEEAFGATVKLQRTDAEFTLVVGRASDHGGSLFLETHLGDRNQVVGAGPNDAITNHSASFVTTRDYGKKIKALRARKLLGEEISEKRVGDLLEARDLTEVFQTISEIVRERR